MVQRNDGSDVDFDWSVSFPFDATAGEAPLELIVMDSDTLRPDDVVGTHVMAHTELISMQDAANAFQGEVELTRKKSGLIRGDKSAGFLQVYIYWETLPTEAFPVPTLHCISNHSAGAGIVKNLMDGGKFSIFRTWQMNLWMVGAAFQGETCGWNQEYKAAQMIDGKDAESKVIRTGIKAKKNRDLYFYSDCYSS